VLVQPNSQACSTNGCYLAAGTWGSTTDDAGVCDVYIVDVAKASVLTTLKPTSQVEGLAFSPDGKWLAVATRLSTFPVGSPRTVPSSLCLTSQHSTPCTRPRSGTPRTAPRPRLGGRGQVAVRDRRPGEQRDEEGAGSAVGRSRLH
jgi:hypothetical protein